MSEKESENKPQTPIDWSKVYWEAVEKEDEKEAESYDKVKQIGMQFHYKKGKWWNKWLRGQVRYHIKEWGKLPNWLKWEIEDAKLDVKELIKEAKKELKEKSQKKNSKTQIHPKRDKEHNT